MQTRIAQRTLVQCPPAQAGRRVTDFFRDHREPNTDLARLSLWIDANVPGLPTPLRIERAVTVTLRPAHREGDMTPRYAVAWGPTEPGPFPLFDGELRVDNDEDYDAFWLVLEGSYEPPLGLVGAAFDRMVGSRIAAICARNLLTHIADAIEHKYLADEAAKVAASR